MNTTRTNGSNESGQAAVSGGAATMTMPALSSETRVFTLTGAAESALHRSAGMRLDQISDKINFTHDALAYPRGCVSGVVKGVESHVDVYMVNEGKQHGAQAVRQTTCRDVAPDIAWEWALAAKFNHPMSRHTADKFIPVSNGNPDFAPHIDPKEFSDDGFVRRGDLILVATRKSVQQQIDREPVEEMNRRLENLMGGVDDNGDNGGLLVSQGTLKREGL